MLTWPPSYERPELSLGPALPCPPAAAAKKWPPPGFPSKAQIDYTTALIALSLLLLMLPWLLGKVVTDPGKLVPNSRWV